jgi:hypothetical protein
MNEVEKSFMENIRQNYGVPADKGVRVKFKGQEGVILGVRNASLKVKLKSGEIIYCHPTFEMEYLT